MSGPWGVTPQGFAKKPLAQVESEIDQGLQKIVGASAATEPDGTIPLESIAGQIKTFFTDPLAAQWDLQQAVYSSFDPNAATNVALDAVCAITGTKRKAQSFSTVVGTVTGAPNTQLQPGRVATVVGTGTRFDLQPNPTDVNAPATTLAALTAWAALTAYLVDARRTNANRAYVCTTPGTSAGAGGPTTQGNAIVDGTVVWKYLGEGTGAGDGPFEAEQPGPLGALAGFLTGIATPQVGWSNVTNLLDATTGAIIEGDPALRARRESELTAEGTSPPDAIRARVLKVGEGTNNPVKACRVFYNDTDLTDANGLPPHSVEVVVLGGPDDTTPAGDTSNPEASVAAAVFSSVGAGIRTVGTTAVNVGDAGGFLQTVRFTRPQEIDIYVVATVYYDPKAWPASGAAALVQQAAISALLTDRERQLVGESVRASPLVGAILDGPSATDTTGTAIVPAPDGSPAAAGLVDVTPLYIGTAPGPGSGAPIAITPFQIARFDSSRIAITATPEAP